MALYFSPSLAAFFDSRSHGAPLIRVPDPDWTRPEREIPDPDDPEKTLTVLDETAIHPMVEVSNPDCKLPADAREISAEAHAAVVAALSCGDNKVLGADAEGNPIAVDALPPSDEALAATARAQRNELLASCDWTQMGDIDPAIRAAHAPYRQALRDVPAQDGFPHTIVWPDAPA